jgi:NLI interacting factor-like phosphatase
VWNEFGEQYDAHNTILVDDSIEKAQEQPDNLVHVSTFDPDQSASDNELVHLMEYLTLLKQQNDVTMYIKRNPYN